MTSPTMKWDVIDTHDGRIIVRSVPIDEAEQWAAQSERAVIVAHGDADYTQSMDPTR